MKVTIDLDPKLWWKLATIAETRGCTIGELAAEMITTGKRLHRRHRLVTPETVDRWVSQYEAGESGTAIAKRENVSNHLVYYHLNRRGIRARQRTEAHHA